MSNIEKKYPKEKQPISKITIFLILFAVISISIAVFFILKHHNKRNIGETKNIEESTITQNTVKNGEFVSDTSKDETKEFNENSKSVNKNEDSKPANKNEGSKPANKNEANELINKNEIKEQVSKNETSEPINKNKVKEPTNENPPKEQQSAVTQTSASTENKVIVIDPGHQTKGNSEKEPIGPGASQTKAKVTGGATGVATGKTEYQINLEVSLKLKTALENKGYTVIMTRSTNNVNISNSERAKIANDANAAAFIRIHCNSYDNSTVKGVLTMCQTANNPYNGNLASKSYSLSKLVLDNVVKQTNAVNKGVTRDDTMSGINWCKVPTTILEMGFMSNLEEDKLLASEEYQNKIVKGIVNGIDEFLK